MVFAIIKQHAMLLWLHVLSLCIVYKTLLNRQHVCYGHAFPPWKWRPAGRAVSQMAFCTIFEERKKQGRPFFSSTEPAQSTQAIGSILLSQIPWPEIYVYSYYCYELVFKTFPLYGPPEDLLISAVCTMLSTFCAPKT